MSDIESLKERLLAVESSRNFGRGTGDMDVTTSWYRNPDGPEAAERITTLEVKLAEAERALERAAADMTCRGDDAHYCPNCDRTTFEARENVRTTLATIREADQ